jgi:flagellar hook-associated protein 2
MGTVSGLGGSPLGFNTDQIVSQLVNSRYGPRIDQLNSEIDQTNTIKSAYQSLNSKVGNLQGAVEALTEPSTFQVKSVSSGNSDIVGTEVVDSQEASTGTKRIFVEQMAEKASVTSGQYIQDQKMATTGGQTLMSDFEQVEGDGELDTSTDYLDALSKSVNTGAGADIRIEQTDDDGDIQSVEIDLDSADIQNFDDLKTAIQNPTDGSISGATTVNNDNFIQNFQSDQWSMNFEYDSSRDVFQMHPTDRDGNNDGTPDGGSAITLEDMNGGSNGFFQQIGFNSAAGPQTYDQRQSQLGENLISVEEDTALDQILTTGNIADGSSGTLEVNGTDISWDTDTSSSDPSTIGELMTAIDENVSGVTANFNTVNDKITLQTENTGSGTISVTDANNGNGDPELADRLNLETEEAAGNVTNEGQAKGASEAGQNAKVQLNGTIITESSNTFTREGVEYDVKELYQESNNTGDPITVNVSQDRSSITEDVSGFVDSFNKAIEFINNKSTVDVSEGSNNSGVFAGETSVQSIKSQITSIATKRYNTATKNGDIQSLADVGIELVDPLTSSESQRGKLRFNESTFKSALQENPEEVRNLFTAVEGEPSSGGDQDGMAVQMNSFVESATGSNGFIATRIDGFSSEVETLNESIESQQERAQNMQSRLQQQYLRMEQQMLRLQRQMSRVSQI